VAQIQPTLLPGFHVDVQLDTTKFIEDSVRELNWTLLLSALLTSIVCFLFLGSWSSTLNVLLAIPTSIVGAFSILYFFGFTLNTFTLLGLSLAIGIVVDDAIMMLENIVRHYDMGKTRLKAAIDGSNEITFAAIATTLTIAAIFIPVIFMQGAVGKFFYQYGITVTAAVFLSLLEAITLTPMRCSQFLRSGKRDLVGGKWSLARLMERVMDGLGHYYRVLLEKCLKVRWWIILVSVCLFTASITVLFGLRKELLPSQDQSLFLLSIRTPVGTAIEATDAVYEEAEKYLRTVPEVNGVYSTVGNYQNNNVVNDGVIYVILKDLKERARSQREITDSTRDGLRRLLPNATVSTQDLSLAGFSASRGFPIEFTIEGPDWSKLQGYSDLIVSRLKKSGLLEDINSDYQVGMPEIDVVPERQNAALRGVSVTTINQEISNLVGGQIFNANTQYPKDSHRYSIRIRSQEGQFSSPKDLDNILLANDRGTAGNLIPLSEVAKIEMTTGPQLISRVNRARAISVYANLATGASQQDALDEVVKAGESILPKNAGYAIKPTGSAEAFHDAFNGLSFALILGIAVAYMVLASQFNSFIHPVTVLMALPFSVSGALIALAITRQSISLFSMIGLILLMGIVKKNSILLVDFTNQRRASGLSATEALLEACPIRLRPILMTSIAIIAGAIPGALNLGPGAETRVPMAVSIIGGVFVSTILTLFVVPCVYSVFVKIERPDIPIDDASSSEGS
jgi:HAE1 family hydrophobic/amphiphilic exporter-1